MRWGALVCIMLFTAAVKSDGVDKAFQTLKARRMQYYEAFGKENFKLTILDCFADKVKLKDLPYGKPARAGTEAVISRDQVRALLKQDSSGFKESETYQHVIATLIYDLEVNKWRREAGKPSFIGTPPRDERRPKTKVMFEKQGERFLIVGVEAAAPAAGE